MQAQFRQIISGEDKRLIARLVRPILAAVAAPYGLAVASRNRLYDTGALRTHRLNVPVVSIGNLTLGGTGKTPLVEFVCRWFLSRGRRPAILSRGYRGAGGRNDEARMLEANLPGVPHLQGKDRLGLARQAIAQFHPDVLVLDDGFQHRRLGRDLDIVLVDCTQPFGYDRLFPRGLLREPVANLGRADLIVLTRANHCSETELEVVRRTVRSASGDRPVVLAENRPIALRSVDGRESPCAEIAGKSVAAFCGIGNPAAFWQTVRSLGCRLIGQRAFPDHHAYTAGNLHSLDEWIRTIGPEAVLTTQKDLVKLTARELGGRPLFAVRTAAALRESPSPLETALEAVLTSAPCPARAA